MEKPNERRQLYGRTGGRLMHKTTAFLADSRHRLTTEDQDGDSVRATVAEIRGAPEETP